MKLLFPEVINKESALHEKFNDTITFFKEGDDIPFAFRAPNDRFCGQYENKKDIFDFDRFRIFQSGSSICCEYRCVPPVTAIISPLYDGEDLPNDTEDRIKRYLSSARELDPYLLPRISAARYIENFVSKTADYCGCLTDIQSGSFNENLPFSDNAGVNKPNGAFIAVSLPVISLMYRRISALRGFNFRVTLSDSLPCLGFSAKVILPDSPEMPSPAKIPEYAILSSIADSDGLIISARLTELDDEDGGVLKGERLCRLSILLSPQGLDPRGILRAPEWRAHTKNIIESLDFDIPGKF